jgi:MarR family 2-MHQ and catechol resistance regulon transcriptional repressor
LYLSLWRASHAVIKADTHSITQAGFRSRTDFAVLEVLLHKGPLTVNAIGSKVLLTSGSITTAVQRLETQGWIRRSPDPADRRKVVVDLTAEGRERIQAAFPGHAQRLEEAFSPLTPDEKEDFIRILRKLKDHHQESSL